MFILQLPEWCLPPGRCIIPAVMVVHSPWKGPALKTGHSRVRKGKKAAENRRVIRDMCKWFRHGLCSFFIVVQDNYERQVVFDDRLLWAPPYPVPKPPLLFGWPSPLGLRIRGT